ncbi:hypothetical protein PC110_g13877 [Phytophthora cactorum]|uniref:Tc1-like transposase DDE domain-containing protein n=1 Tax=Phytophthora cactorum TaxID=29920 RepID=A0A329RZ14_9STRA|nr:hypothetical protein PC110_g13877 [Phytophthora cactorum]
MKFNLDGPDYMQYYWHDLRHEPEVYSTRQSGGGSVMVWGAFCANDTVYGREWIFQHDNASIHASSATKEFLKEEKVDVM